MVPTDVLDEIISITPECSKEVLDSLETPQDCLEFISGSLLPEHRALVDKEIVGNFGGDYRAAGFYIGADPEYQRFYKEYFIPTIDKLGSFELEPERQERVMQAMVTMYSGFSSYDTYSEDIFLLFSKHMLQNGGVQAFPNINAMYDRYFEGISSDLIQDENTAKSYLASSRVDGINSRAGALPGRLALLLAGEIKDGNLPPEETVEFSLSFVDKYPHGSLRTFSDAMESMGVENSVPILLSHLSDENEQSRRFVAEILFRLELGKVGVSEKGVEYLGKLYDLAKFNDLDLFVRRINNSGLLAILNQKGSIEGVFDLDLESIEEIIKPEVRQLTSRDIFLPRADETEEQKKQREEYLKLFVDNYESIFNDDFFKGTNIRLNSLDLHEQGWFILYYLELSKKGDQEAIDRLKSFVAEYDDDGLKSFLTLEYGGSGQEILDFAGNKDLTKEEKLSIFKNFNVICSEATGWRHIFEDVEKDLEYDFSIEAYESLIRKNAEFFKAAQIMSKDPSKKRELFPELLSSMNSVANALRVLQSFYKEYSRLTLVNATSHDEYGEDGNLIEGVRNSWAFQSVTGEKVSVTVRSKNTIDKEGRKDGGPRVQYKVTNPVTGDEVRISFDLSYYRKLIGESDSPLVSLDLGILNRKLKDVTYGTESVGRILSLVEGSEGGHNESSFRPEASKHFEDIANSFVEYINRTFSS